MGASSGVIQIDWISGGISLKTVDPVAFRERFNTGETLVVSPDGEILSERSRFEPVEGTYSDKVAYRADWLSRSLRLDGNPGKFILGHNCWGLEHDPACRGWNANRAQQIGHVWSRFYAAVREKVPGLPGEDEAEALGFGSLYMADFSRFDLTRSIRFRDDAEARSFLRALGVSGHSRHRNAKVTEGTIYFGKNSKRWAMKAYLKSDELLAHRPNVEPVAASRLGEWACGVVRFEVTLRSKELKRVNAAGYETLEDVWSDYYGRITMADRGNVVDVSAVEGLPSPVKVTYQAWMAGQDVREVMTRPTFYRYRRQILDAAGVDIAEPPAPVGSDLFGKPDIDDKRWDPEPFEVAGS